MSDFSGLKQNDTLQQFYDKHNSRLPVEPISYEIGKCKNETSQNRATNAKVAIKKENK
jgi:hypothetical protein